MSNVRIFVVPGLSASQLVDRRGDLGLVWIDPGLATLNAEFTALARKSSDDGDARASVSLEANDFLPVLFAAMIEALEFSFEADVERFPFDWRAGIPQNGLRLARRLSAATRAPDAKVAVIAHSMGGLVLADACRRLPPDQLGRVVGNVTLGTPWLGSYEAACGLTLADLVPQPFAPLLDHDVDTIRSVFQTFRGLAHLLPAGDPRAVDPALYAPGPLATDRGLQQGLADVATLVRTPPPRTVAIVSDSHSTRDGMTVTDGRVGWQFAPGDGMVSLRSATIGGTLAAELVEAGHSLMPLHPSVIRRTVKLLTPMLGVRRPFASILVDGLAAIFERAPAPDLTAHRHLSVLARWPFAAAAAADPVTFAQGATAARTSAAISGTPSRLPATDNGARVRAR